MFGRVEWMIAFRYIRVHRTESFISVIAGFSFLGIVLGVATLIVVLAVMDGFRHELLGRILGLNGHIILHGIERPVGGYEGLATKIRKLDGIHVVTPIVDGQVMAASKNTAAGALVRGIKIADLKNLKIVSSNIKFGSLDVIDVRNDIVIGIRLAQILGVSMGSKVTLLSPQTTATPFGSVPRARAYRIAAIFDVGMFEYDASYIFMPLKASQLFFLYEDSVPALEVRLENPEMIEQARELITPVMGDGLQITDWQQINSSYVNALKVERNVMFLILTLIILVAAFNIISGLVMLVKDKGRDIAILRSIGASRYSIMRIFIITGACIGIVGTVVGACSGVIFAQNIDVVQGWLEHLTGVELFAAEIYFLSNLPSSIVWSDVAAVICMSLSLSLLATLYPSWRAARVTPVEALRYE